MEQRESLVDIIRVLLLVEAGIAVVMALEGLAAILFAGPLGAATAVLGVAGAILMLLLTRGVGRRSRLARKLTLWIQAGIVLVALIDLVLAVVIAQRGLELVPLLTRVALPISIFVLLRRDPVREEFGVRTRAQKREYKRAKRRLKKMPRPMKKLYEEVAA